MCRKIEELLDTLFPNPEIPLKHEDPYTLLIATLLSAQCTDNRVNKITPNLFAKAKTPAAMSNLPLHEIESLIKSCGLYKTKAKAILELSIILKNQYNSKVPASFKALESLPGVGHKTASCVMAHAFKVPAFPVDTHIHRLAKRFGLSNGKSVIQTEKDLKKLFPKSHWNKLHLQLIYYARAYCPALRHKTELCPICSMTASMIHIKHFKGYIMPATNLLDF